MFSFPCLCFYQAWYEFYKRWKSGHIVYLFWVLQKLVKGIIEIIPSRQSHWTLFHRLELSLKENGGFDKTNEQRTPLTLLGKIEDIFSFGKITAHRILNRQIQTEAIMPQGKSKLWIQSEIGPQRLQIFS